MDMSCNRFLYIFMEDLESFIKTIVSMGNKFQVRVTDRAGFADAIADDISALDEPEDISFAVVLAKSVYFDTDVKFFVMERIVDLGLAAEPVFIVVADSFTPGQMREVVDHNDTVLIAPLAAVPDDGRGNAYITAAVLKSLHDYDNNRKVIIQMRESFIHFIDSEKQKEEKDEMEKLNDELLVENKIDALTRIFNRKGLIVEYEIARSRTRREKKYIETGEANEHIGRLSCMLIDIDNFKKINDTYGHLVGDRVLQRVAQLLLDKTIFRLEDICGRYGGEEFVVLFPNTHAQHAKIPAERFRSTLRSIEFPGDDGSVFVVTASIGIAEIPYGEGAQDDPSQAMADLEVLIHQADMAMYRAKEQGKDRTVIY